MRLVMKQENVCSKQADNHQREGSSREQYRTAKKRRSGIYPFLYRQRRILPAESFFRLLHFSVLEKDCTIRVRSF